jgi:hypothetical protein
MPNQSLFSLMSDAGRAAYARLLDRPENSAGGGDVGTSIRWPSPLAATDDHRIVAQEMTRILGGSDYNWAYVGHYGDLTNALRFEAQDRRSFEGWLEDYNQRSDRLAGLPAGSDPSDPRVRQTLQDVYRGIWPGEGFPIPDNSIPPAGMERDFSGRVLEYQEFANGPTQDRTVDLRSDSQWSALVENRDANGSLISESGTNRSGASWSESLNGDNSTFTFNGQTFSGTQLASGAGLTLGSTIGGILGGNSLAGRIVGSTVLGTLGQSVGDALVRSGLGTALLGNGTLTSSMLDNAVTTTIADFGGNLAPNAIGNIAGSFSSLLFGEAAQALGLHGFAGGLFTTIGTSITSQLATNLGAMTLNSVAGTTLTTAFSPDAFVGNIGGAIGGYFGSYLAAQIVPATGIASSIGGRIGGAIGGFLASEIPVVGTFFGSLVGSVLGTLVGGLFDPHIVPWSSEMVGAVNGVLGINYWNWNGGGNPQEFTALSNLVAGQANQVLALTRRDPNIMNITGLTSINELVFNQLGSTLTAIYPDGNSTNFYVDGMPQWFALQALYNTSEIATYELVQHAVLVGSDPIVTGALAAARVQDTTTPAIYADLLVAQDYERYRANAEIINTAMAANPNSDFTAGWNLTLLRAQALGLDRIVTHAGWTADLTDSHETIRDAGGNVVQQLTFNADGSATTDTGTLVFNFNFVDARLSYGIDGRAYLTAPDGVRRDVTGATRLFFNDGHIDEADGNPLVDDLYYDSQYHDVYLAGVDPDAHYAASGWHEGRNPNAYFDTNYYLSRNPDVAAAGINPLMHYDGSGWHEGRNPSARFSTRGYLSAYPDVAAAGSDPLVHYLQYGMAEGRNPRGTDTVDHDFNGDGIADIFWRNTATEHTGIWFMNSGGGTFTWQDTQNVPADWQVEGSGDLNGDGRSDIFWHNTATGQTGIWYMNRDAGTYTWQETQNVPTEWRVGGIGDFNGDGRADIFWQNTTTAHTGIWYMNRAAGTFAWQDTQNVPAEWQVQGTGDFNGDGRADLFWHNMTTAHTGIWYMNAAAGSFAWQDTQDVPTDWQVPGTGDFNGDGRDDLLWRNTANAGIGLWNMGAGPGAYSWQDLGSIPLDWTIPQVSDFGGDGRADILWRNTTSGDVGLWNSNAGVGQSSWQDIQIVPTAWRVN